ncbi:MAG: CDP-alcohol phosphatidyltransferase family protein [Bacteroidota bacterium]
MKKHIPNIITLMNLFCGCIAIDFAFANRLDYTAYFVFLAAVFDFFDGFAARMLKVHSELGKQLDSLADVVTFGVVPGVVLSNLMSQSIFSHPHGDGNWMLTIFIYAPYLVTLFSALRLGMFNLDTRQSDSFIGVPTPASTLFIVSLPLILLHDDFKLSGIILNTYFLLGLSLIMSYLLVAELPLIALKFKNFTWKDNALRFTLIGASVLLFSIFFYVAIPLIIVLYIILSLVNNLKTT